MLRQSINHLSKTSLVSQLPKRLQSTDANKLVNLEVNDKTGIAVLTLNRAPVNSLNLELLQDISQGLDEVAKNRSKGLILASVS